jgi:hypothetical protein
MAVALIEEEKKKAEEENGSRTSFSLSTLITPCCCHVLFVSH